MSATRQSSGARHGSGKAWTDAQLLTALHMRDHEGKNSTEIGAALGVSRSSVLGALHRVTRDKVPDAPGMKPENRNGGMPVLWWKRGQV